MAYNDKCQSFLNIIYSYWGAYVTPVYLTKKPFNIQLIYCLLW